MRGAPKLFSITTLRPLGPSVTFTAFASVSTPRSMRSRASDANFTSLAAISFSFSMSFQLVDDTASGRLFERRCRLDHAENVALLHDEQFLAVDADFAARPFAEQSEEHPSELQSLIRISYA